MSTTRQRAERDSLKNKNKKKQKKSTKREMVGEGESRAETISNKRLASFGSSTPSATLSHTFAINASYNVMRMKNKAMERPERVHCHGDLQRPLAEAAIRPLSQKTL